MKFVERLKFYCSIENSSDCQFLWQLQTFRNESLINCLTVNFMKAISLETMFLNNVAKATIVRLYVLITQTHFLRQWLSSRSSETAWNLIKGHAWNATLGCGDNFRFYFRREGFTFLALHHRHGMVTTDLNPKVIREFHPLPDTSLTGALSKMLLGSGSGRIYFWKLVFVKYILFVKSLKN